jgi:aarF domain-containing kinase
VPEVVRALSSARVLTMEFIDGAGVTDLQALRRMGADPGRLSQLINETFSEMIFIHGYVHCDPHAANMLVRRRVSPAGWLPACAQGVGWGVGGGGGARWPTAPCIPPARNGVRWGQWRWGACCCPTR